MFSLKCPYYLIIGYEEMKVVNNGESIRVGDDGIVQRYSIIRNT